MKISAIRSCHVFIYDAIVGNLNCGIVVNGGITAHQNAKSVLFLLTGRKNPRQLHELPEVQKIRGVESDESARTRLKKRALYYR